MGLCLSVKLHQMKLNAQMIHTDDELCVKWRIRLVILRQLLSLFCKSFNTPIISFYFASKQPDFLTFLSALGQQLSRLSEGLFHSF